MAGYTDPNEWISDKVTGLLHKKSMSVVQSVTGPSLIQSVNRSAKQSVSPSDQPDTPDIGDSHRKSFGKKCETYLDGLAGKSTLDCASGSSSSNTNSDDYRYKIDFVKFGEKTENKTLPVYQYREDLLKAVEKYQVLVIVGGLGSEKTTQIPKYLHEAGYTDNGKIGCIQPRRVAAKSASARVAKDMGVKLGHEVGYSVLFDECTSHKTVLKFITDDLLLREFLCEPDLDGYSVVMVDEAHERTLSTDVLLCLLKDTCRLRSDLKLLICSTAPDAHKFSHYFVSAPVFQIPGSQFPVEILYTEAPEPDYLDAVVITVLQIHAAESPGDILVFLTGQADIEAAEELLIHRMRRLGITELIVCPIYANLPLELQSRIIQPSPACTRKVYLATNFGESSLMVDEIKYVIDSGFLKTKSYNPQTGVESLLITPVSKASANQRAGRLGRTCPGKCYRLYTADFYFNHMEDNDVPEIRRANLSNVVLTLKSLGVHDLLNFDFMDPPPVAAVTKALETLFALNALNNTGELTKVGRNMCEFPVDCMLSRMIVASEKFKCSAEVISIAAMLSLGNSIFYCPKDKQVHADNAWSNFRAGNHGDHVALLKVYTAWKEADFSTDWCKVNHIQVRSMKLARNIRHQLERLLKKVDIELKSNPNDLESVKKAVISGFFQHSAKLQEGGTYQTLNNPQTVYIHPNSGLAKLLPRLVIYHELVLTTKTFMRQVTELKPEWLVEVAPQCYQLEDFDDGKSKKMPRGKGRAPD